MDFGIKQNNSLRGFVNFLSSYSVYRAMCSDLVYVILFPQLLIVVHFKDWCNTYGSLFAYILGMSIRICGGEPLINFPPLVKFWGFDEEAQQQRFPFRTMAMVLSMISLLGVSALMRSV